MKLHKPLFAAKKAQATAKRVQKFYFKPYLGGKRVTKETSRDTLLWKGLRKNLSVCILPKGLSKISLECDG